MLNTLRLPGRLLWGLSAVIVGAWSLLVWASYALLTGAGGLIIPLTEFLLPDPGWIPAVESAVGGLGQVAQVLAWLVWALGTAALLAGAWLLQKLSRHFGVITRPGMAAPGRFTVDRSGRQ